MRKVVICLLSIAFFSLFAKDILAQKNFRVGISMGQVTPLKAFKSIENGNPSSGYAESGFMLNFDGDYYLHNRLAVSARFHFGLSSINKNEVSNWLESDMFDYLNENTEKNLYSIDFWQWSAPMLGLKYNYPIVVNKLYIETAGFTGLSIVQIPNQNLKIISDLNKQDLFSENIDGRSIHMPVMIDAGFRFILNETIQLKIMSSYFQTRANYEHVNYLVEENSVNINNVLKRTQMEVPIQTINISVGLIYKIQ